MAEISRQPREQRADVLALAVPSDKCVDGKRVAEIVNTRLAL